MDTSEDTPVVDKYGKRLNVGDKVKISTDRQWKGIILNGVQGSITSIDSRGNIMIQTSKDIIKNEIDKILFTKFLFSGKDLIADGPIEAPVMQAPGPESHRQRYQKERAQILQEQAEAAQPERSLAVRGYSIKPKIIIFLHGSIINMVKQDIIFPYNRLIYYVNKGRTLMVDVTPDLISGICNHKATKISHKFPINNRLSTYPQLLMVNRTADLEHAGFVDTMGIYVCSPGIYLEKLLSWQDFHSYIYGQGLTREVHTQDGVNVVGVRIEEVYKRLLVVVLNLEVLI
jgi:hypothetical protein